MMIFKGTQLVWSWKNTLDGTQSRNVTSKGPKKHSKRQRKNWDTYNLPMQKDMIQNTILQKKLSDLMV